MLSLLLLPAVLGLNLELLFARQIRDTACLARCKAGSSQEKCWQQCRIEEPARPAGPAPSAQLTALTLHRCRVSWTVDPPVSRLTFLVAGKDGAGMWNLVADRIVTRRISLTPQLTAKLVKLQVFAINEWGVVDKISMELKENHCHERVPRPRLVALSEQEEKVEGEAPRVSMVVAVVLGAVAGGTLALTIAVICCRLRRAREPQQYFYVERRSEPSQAEDVKEVEEGKYYYVDEKELPYQSVRLAPPRSSPAETLCLDRDSLYEEVRLQPLQSLGYTDPTTYQYQNFIQNQTL